MSTENVVRCDHCNHEIRGREPIKVTLTLETKYVTVANLDHVDCCSPDCFVRMVSAEYGKLQP